MSEKINDDALQALKIAFSYMPKAIEVNKYEYGDRYQTVLEHIQTVRETLLLNDVDPEEVYGEINPDSTPNSSYWQIIKETLNKDTMNNLSAFPITQKWPAQHPELLQLYSLPTPNGVKVSIMLEEIGLAYEPHLVSFDTNDQLSPEFLSLNPNNKIPAIIDPNGPNNQPLALFESGAILIYLADKTQQLIPVDMAGRYHTIQWLMFQMGGIGPMFGQVGFFNKFAGKHYEDKRPLDRYVAESKRLLSVLDQQLKAGPWIMGETYSIADIATFPWVRNLIGFYEARDLVGIENFPNVLRSFNAFLARPAVIKGLTIPQAKV